MADEVKKRIYYFDQLRALAILLVILVHVSYWFFKNQTPYSLTWYSTLLLSSFGKIGVPLFLMISGALLLNRRYELSSFFKKRFMRVLTPFIFWIICIILFKVLVMNADLTLENIINITFFEGFIWFVWTILGLYLFTPVINSFVREYSLRGAEFFLIIWIVFIILTTLNVYPIKNIEIRYFSGYLGYFVLGWYLANKKTDLSDKSLVLISVTVFIIATLLNFTNLSMVFDFKEYYLTLIPLIQSASLFVLFKHLNFTRFKNTVTSLSICSYGMYLTHYFLIWTLLRFNHRIHIFDSNPIYLPLVFIAAVLFSWALVRFMSRIPYLGRFSGA